MDTLTILSYFINGHDLSFYLVRSFKMFYDFSYRFSLPFIKAFDVINVIDIMYDIDIINAIKCLNSIFNFETIEIGVILLLISYVSILVLLLFASCNNFTDFFMFITCKLCGLEIKIVSRVTFLPALARASVLCFAGMTVNTVTQFLVLFYHEV